jgi:EmrB/QacA subfamily drug resistance transporter
MSKSLPRQTKSDVSHITPQAELDEADGLRFASSSGRWVLLATVLGSAVVMLDGTVVNVALPVIGRDLDAGVDGLQWTISGYLVTLASLILLGGSLGDRFGRRRVFVIGVSWFAAASLLCGLAPDLQLLIAARVLQGIGGALLTPGSLAILQASFHPDDRAQAIGAWSGLGGIASAVGPFLGGWLIQAVSWRLIFLLNLPLALAVVLVAVRHVPETSDADSAGQLDWPGAVLAVLGLSGTTFALIEAPTAGMGSPLILAAAVVGAVCLVGFVVVEARSRQPMLPLSLFKSRQFTGANLVTLAVYGAFGGVFFLLIVPLQQVLGYSPVQAGIATLPITLLMLLLSARAGKLAQRIGPRIPLSLGPIMAAAGIALMARIDAGGAYVLDVLPAMIVFGGGISLTVAPLTATVMGAVESSHAGVASAVNNAVARAAGLIAVALLPALAGLTGAAYLDPVVFSSGFHRAMLMCAALTALGGILGWITLSEKTPVAPQHVDEFHCSLDAPPLRPAALRR